MAPTELCAWDRAEWQSTHRGPDPMPDAVLTALEQATTAEGERTDAPVPEALLGWVRELRGQLARVGMVLTQGFPVEAWSLPRVRAAYAVLGEAMGTLVPQSTQRETVFSVTNEGAPGASAARGARSGTALDFHTDCAPNWMDATPDVIGLLAVRDAPEGGETLVACAATVARMVERCFPDLTQALYSTFIFDRRTELRPDDDPLYRSPILERRADGVAVRFAPVYLARGHERAGQPMTSDQMLAVVSFCGLAYREELHVRVKLQPGQCLWLENRRMIHARLPFADGAERRHMLRLWVVDRNAG